MSKFPSLKKVAYEDIRSELADGDLLLCSGEYMFSKIIQKATKSPWSHVAFILRLESIDRVMVLESIEDRGVRTIPLSEYVRNFEGTNAGYKGRVAIGRHSDFSSHVTQERLRKLAQFAVDRFSFPYDQDEISRITARIVGYALGFKHSEVKRDNEYICSEYVEECYRAFGIRVPYNKKAFIAPADFAPPLLPEVELLWEIKVSSSSAGDA